MSNKKPETPKIPDALSEEELAELKTKSEEELASRSDEYKVTFVKPCNYAGKMKTKGDVIRVTKAQAEHLDSLGLIK